MKKTLPAPNKADTEARGAVEHPAITEAKIVEYLQTFGLAKKLQPNEIGQFTRIACEFQLNPFKREIYCVAYGSGDSRACSIIVGYEVYIKRAERTGKLDGWKVWVEGEGDNLKALVEINRKDWQHPFIHEVYWKEAAQKRKDGEATSFWTRMPRFQLKKVAISQGFRLCFPDELGGLPYDDAELGIETRYPEQANLNASCQIAPEKEERGSENAGGESTKAETTKAETTKPVTAIQKEAPREQPEPSVSVQNESPQTPPNSKPANPSKPATIKAAGEAIIAAIGEILNSADPEGRRYFTDDEKADAHQIVVSVKVGEPGLKELQGFKEFLAGELAKREHNRKAA
jgi:phage recombination protein Bet